MKHLIKNEFFPTLSSFGFTIYKNNLIISPTDDLLKGFCFDRHDERLYVHLFVQPLYIPYKHQTLNYGWRLKGDTGLGDMFLLKDEQMNFTTSEIKRLLLLEKDVLLETKNALNFLNNFLLGNRKLIASKNEKDIRYKEALTYTEAYVYPEQAGFLVDRFLQLWEADPYNNAVWMKEIRNNMLLLKEASASVEQVKVLFEKWKEFSYSNLKLPENVK